MIYIESSITNIIIQQNEKIVKISKIIFVTADNLFFVIKKRTALQIKLTAVLFHKERYSNSLK